MKNSKHINLPRKRIPKKDSDEHCNARTRYRQGYCRRVSGWGTDHLRQGRCKLHGGATPVKFGAYSKIVPKEHQHLLEDVKIDELRDLTHEIVKLKSYLISLTNAEDVYEPIVDVDGKNEVKGVKFSSLTEAELLDYSIKIIGMLDKLISSLNVEKERAAKRDDSQREFLKFIKPIVDALYEELDKVVRDVRIERADIPEAHKERMMNREDWS